MWLEFLQLMHLHGSKSRTKGGGSSSNSSSSNGGSGLTSMDSENEKDECRSLAVAAFGFLLASMCKSPPNGMSMEFVNHPTKLDR